MQRNWIGRSTGADVGFAIEGRDEPVTVYTTRPDTLFGATFFVVAADSDLAAELAAGTPSGARSSTRTCEQVAADQRDRPAVHRPARRPASSWTGTRSTRSTASGCRSTPPTTCWPTTAHGAIMAVPAHDQRDLDFARTFGLPVRVVVDTGEAGPAPTPGRRRPPATACWSTPARWTGCARTRRSRAIIEIAGRAAALGRAAVNYRLRDWLISRQRYWGTPIPIIHCPACGEVPVPDDQLPVALPPSCGPGPDAQGHVAAGRGHRLGRTSTARTCGGPAERDTDTMDTFVDSSWYFLRFCSPDRDDGAVRPGRGRPVDAGRPVRRRRDARDPAPAVRAVLHQGAARPGHGRRSPSRSRAC